MRNRKPVQNISFKYNLTRKKYVNLHKRITDLIKDGSFYELTEKLRKNMWRRLHLLYRRLLKLISRTTLTTAALTASFFILTNTADAQTFTEQTGTSNPFNGVDIGTKSSTSFVDIDGDGDMDAFFGEFYGTIKYYKNTGTALVPAFTEQTGTNNPLNFDVGDRAAPSFVDIDGDGDMDAFSGEYLGVIKYYKNTGTALAPAFTEQTGTNNPFDGVDVGAVSTPSFKDLDGDGDMDAFIGEGAGNINYYKNTGTALAPAFTVQTGTNNPFNGVNVGPSSSSNFIDVDNDGDMDAFIGETAGNINYYKNTGTALAPAFTEQTGTNNPFNGVDVGSNSTPSFVDIDNDGDIDSFIGESTGTILYYKNTSSLHTASFAAITTTDNPFNGVDVGQSSTPGFADLDRDGDLDAFIGEYFGTLKYYKNTGTAVAPAFTEQTGTNSPLNGINFEARWTPNFADIDGDGDFDAILGVRTIPKFRYYENTGTALSFAFTEQTGTNNPFNSLSPGIYAAPSFVDIDNDGDLDLIAGKNLSVLYYKNTGTTIAPAFTEQTGTNNPFNGFTFGNYARPRFMDIDRDGDMDAFIGESDGTINYYKNTGTALAPAFTEQTGTNNPFNGVDVGSKSAPSFADLDGDGDFDAFIGENGGTIKVYADGTNALPVELTSFNAFVQDNSVVLNWNTATEVNNYGFEIERMILKQVQNDKKKWGKIGFVQGHGNTNTPNSYSFIDNNTLGGLKFNYRLKQIDVDGKFEYSDILTVSLTTPQKAELMQNSPNPFNPSTAIKFFIPNTSDVTIKIYDLRGREVTTLIQEQSTAGFHIVFWNGRNSRGMLASSGVYFYRLLAVSEVGNFTETKKMMLLK